MGDWKNNDWGGSKKNDSNSDWKANDWGKDWKDDKADNAKAKEPWPKNSWDDTKANDWGNTEPKADDTKDSNAKADDWSNNWKEPKANDTKASDAKVDDWSNKEPKADDTKAWGNKNWDDSKAWDKKEANQWSDDNWTPPEDATLACLRNTKKEWTKDGWEAAEQKKVENKEQFYESQKMHLENKVTCQKSGWELDEEENTIFGFGSANAGIDFNMYENIQAEVKGNNTENLLTATSFAQLFEQFSFLPQELMENIRRCGYQIPTPVQKFAIPIALSGRDVMCCAQTGSGKTASFLIPIVGGMMRHHTNPIGSMSVPFEGECDPDTLILAPTRELCVQIYKEACKFTHRTPYRVVRIYGGEKATEQIQEICKGTDVLVATPGRLLDFIERKLIRLDRVFHLVIDEADRMLDMGFAPQVRQLITEYHMPNLERRQTMMFSATFSDEVQTLAEEFLYDHVWIGIGRVGGAVETVTQEFVEVTENEKVDKLMDLLDNFLDTRIEGAGEVAIIFCNSKNTAKFLDEHLYEKKVDSGAIHGELKQAAREDAIRKIRNSEIDVLVATDIASRGLDIDKVRLVINYDLPTEVDSYIHRIGRTGRIGNRGKAISFVARDASTGFPQENLTVLKELVNILNYTNNEVPVWLQPLINMSEPDPVGGFGGRDARHGKYGSYEEREREKPTWKSDPASNDWYTTPVVDAWKKDDAAATASGGNWNTWDPSTTEEKDGNTETAKKENGAEQKGEVEAPNEAATCEWSGNEWSGDWNSNWK